MELCNVCELLECDEFVSPLCRVCYRELSVEIDDTLHADAVRFQKYLVAAMKLSSHALTKRLLTEGLCPYLHRSKEAEARARRLLQADEQLAEQFQQMSRV